METSDARPDAGRVRLEPWGEGDLWLLRRTNTPEMTEHLGGPESEEQLADRQRRYAELSAGAMYRVVLVAGGETVGSIGFWEREWRGSTVWETGWGVLPEFQGRGLAAAAARAVIVAAREAGRHRYLHAYPKVEHAASNRVCRAAGFTLLGQADFEYPKGNPITTNDWRYDLARASAGPER
ncbi:GNAT family N-acetyltransferase [Streptomyces mangrovisoli]|uniref:GNAT family N-acetyltransferase n=1 Tax=Streptomyces mangrovisoli TaxID=1428628 RepID=A0A1J4NUM1_9ACTN|nr:GNAT family N-acetyltransferase [Streptomyces mangrovisoli]OIJ66193.1 GNAT family N-acetyltransferase [Streptomyces mangrovisoli]